MQENYRDSKPPLLLKLVFRYVVPTPCLLPPLLLLLRMIHLGRSTCHAMSGRGD